MTAPSYGIGVAAGLLGVSPDTVRRWADEGGLATSRTSGGGRRVAGVELASFMRERRAASDRAASTHIGPVAGVQSARNRFDGIVTAVVRDGVMAQVEIQAGPHRVVSLLSAEAVDELGLEPGVLAAGVVKATNVVIETTPPPTR